MEMMDLRQPKIKSPREILEGILLCSAQVKKSLAVVNQKEARVLTQEEEQ
jgi:hypothetical protein